MNSIRKKNQFRGRRGSIPTEGGSIGETPKDWVQRTTLIELDQEKKSVQGTEGGSIPTEGGSIGEIPKDWVQRTTLIELDKEKKSVQGTEWGSIGEIPKEIFEFRGRTVVSWRKKLSSGRRKGIRSRIMESP